MFQKIEGKKLPYNTLESLKELYTKFNLIECEKVKEIERKCNHDVKAVEYYLIEKFKLLGIYKYSYFIHFGLTSQDINNTSTTLSIREFIFDVYIPNLTDILHDINRRHIFGEILL